MEYLFHFFVKTMVFPWIAGESNDEVPSERGMRRFRYSRRLYAMWAAILLLFALAILVGLMRFPQKDAVRFLLTMTAFALLFSVPFLFAVVYEIELDNGMVRIRRLLRPRIQVRAGDIESISVSSSGLDILVRTTRGEQIRLPKFVRGIDRLVDQLEAGRVRDRIDLSFGNLASSSVQLE